MAQALRRKRFPASRTVGTALVAVVLTATLLGAAVLRETGRLPYLGDGTTDVAAPVTSGADTQPVDAGDAARAGPATTVNRPTDERTALHEGVMTESDSATKITKAHITLGIGFDSGIVVEQRNVMPRAQQLPGLGVGFGSDGTGTQRMSKPVVTQVPGLNIGFSER
jgi:hypothetical protein